MTTPHKATPEQWNYQDQAEFEGDATASCILELCDRIAALEVTQHAHADASRMSDAERERFYAELAKPARIEALDANQPHQQDKLDRLIALDRSDPAPAPAGGLVAKVTDAVVYGIEISDQRGAIDAIHAVAEWFDAIGYGATASILRQELQRHA
jgi:hypothetical protein